MSYYTIKYFKIGVTCYRLRDVRKAACIDMSLEDRLRIISGENRILVRGVMLVDK